MKEMFSRRCMAVLLRICCHWWVVVDLSDHIFVDVPEGSGAKVDLFCLWWL